MAYEPSELMFAGAILFPVDTLKDVISKSQKSNPKKGEGFEALDAFLDKILGSMKNIYMGEKLGTNSDADVIAFKNKVTIAKPKSGKPLTDSEMKSNMAVYSDIIRGISAAVCVREDVLIGAHKKATPTVYMTGNKWHPDIEPFNIKLNGQKFAYNSTDIMLGFGKSYYGISLKKKDTPDAPDPTLINKTFQNALAGPNFKQLLKDVTAAKTAAFAGIVLDAVNAGVISWKDVCMKEGVKAKTQKKFSEWANSPEGLAELIECKYIDKTLFGKEKYVNTKGWSGSGFSKYTGSDYLIPNEKDLGKIESGLSEKKVLKNPKSMRAYVNGRLKEKDMSKNAVFNSYAANMSKYASVLGNSLISIILKTELNDRLKAVRITDDAKIGKGKALTDVYDFYFFLVTGTGSVSITKKTEINPRTKAKSVVENANVSYSKGTSTSLKTILCGLTRIENDLKKKGGYFIELDAGKAKERNAAKIFLKLKRGTKSQSVDILEMEFRFKGDFMADPQFQAVLSKDFKVVLSSDMAAMYKKECKGY